MCLCETDHPGQHSEQPRTLDHENLTSKIAGKTWCFEQTWVPNEEPMGVTRPTQLPLGAPSAFWRTWHQLALPSRSEILLPT